MIPEKGLFSRKESLLHSSSVFVLSFLFLLTIFVFGPSAEKIVSVKVINSVDKFQPGQSFPLALELLVSEPYHINSDQPLEEYLIPTTVEFKPQDGVTFGRIVFPPARIKRFDFSESPLAVYEHTVRIFTSVALYSDFKEKELLVEGKVGYQACDFKSCLTPAAEAFSQRFPVAGVEETLIEVNKDIFSQSQKLASSARPEKVISRVEEQAERATRSFRERFGERGLLLTLLLVFLGGLALNLTPCVYPLIPITVSYFGGQAQGKKGSLILHSGLYVIGLALTYSILGVIAAFSGGLFGSALQYPIVLIAIALVMVILALSMFGIFELRLPAFLSQLAGKSRKGFLGTFFMGLTVGIVAAPCIGPFVLGLLTYVGEKGNVFLGFWLFFILALGLGIPFLFLGIFSGSLSRLPRSGAWMVWVRTIFGFILLALAIYFLKPLFPNTLFYYLALALTMLIAGIYLAWIEPTKTSGKAFPIVRNLFGVLFFIVGLFLAVKGIQAYLDEAVAGQIKSGFNAGAKEKAVKWFSYAEEKLAEASRRGQPVLIDFYADWCLPCKEMDRFTFSDPKVIETSREMMMLKVDLTTTKNPQSREVQQRFQVKGVPTLIFLTSKGKELHDLRAVGFEEKKEFLAKMKRALEMNKN